MKILSVDIGTGTQDILLFDSGLDPENGFKLVLPSPTMMVHRRLKRLLAARTPVLLTGHQMGGGPSAWAIEADRTFRHPCLHDALRRDHPQR